MSDGSVGTYVSGDWSVWSVVVFSFATDKGDWVASGIGSNSIRGVAASRPTLSFAGGRRDGNRLGAGDFRAAAACDVSCTRIEQRGFERFASGGLRAWHDGAAGHFDACAEGDAGGSDDRAAV